MKYLPYGCYVDESTSKDLISGINNKIADAMPKTIQILDLWRKKEFAHVSDEYDRSTEEACKSDSLYKFLLNLAHQMADEISKHHAVVLKQDDRTVDDIADEIVEDIGLNFPIHTKKTADSNTSEFLKYTNAKKNIDLRYYEIKTMLSACDTYEQEMAVLKSYGVIDDNGKLNASTI